MNSSAKRHMRSVSRAVAAVLAALLVSGCGSDGDDEGSPPPAISRPANLALEAHDGMIVQAGDQYILYGTSYGCGYALGQPGTPWCGVRAYASKDLVSWHDEGLMFDPASWQERCAPSATSFGCFRPHVQRRADGVWVMWLNVADNANAGYAVFTAPSPLGPWKEEPDRPRLAVHLGGLLPYGDHDIRVDANGVGWVAYTVIDSDTSLHELVVEKLTPSLTTGTGEFVRLGLSAVEAPALTERNGTWYLAYSDPMCAYCGGTGTSYQTAPSPLGPWTLRGAITTTSCNGQPAAINPLTIDGKPTWLYQSDVWHQLRPGVFNPNQTQALTHLEPLRFAEDGALLPIACADTY